MRRIAVISKPQKNELQTLLPELVAWLKAKGVTPVLDPVSGSYIGTGEVVPRQDMAALHPELVIVLGGMARCSRRRRRLRRPRCRS